MICIHEFIWSYGVSHVCLSIDPNLYNYVHKNVYTVFLKQQKNSSSNSAMKSWIYKNLPKEQALALHRYFQNKRAIIATFADVFRDAQYNAISYCLELRLRGASWKEVVRNYMLMLSTGIIDETWIAPAHLAIRSDRGLKERHELLLDEISEQFVLLLRSFRMQLSDARILQKSRMLILFFDSYMLSMGRLMYDRHAMVQKDYEEVIFAFLESYLQDEV